MKKYLWLILLPIFAISAEAANVKVIIDVENMSCSLCVTSINQALRTTKGVITAKAALKTKRAEVTVPENFPVQTLLDAIAKAGYDGKVVEIQKIP